MSSRRDLISCASIALQCWVWICLNVCNDYITDNFFSSLKWIINQLKFDGKCSLVFEKIVSKICKVVVELILLRSDDIIYSQHWSDRHELTMIDSFRTEMAHTVIVNPFDTSLTLCVHHTKIVSKLLRIASPSQIVSHHKSLASGAAHFHHVLANWFFFHHTEILCLQTSHSAIPKCIHHLFTI